LSAKLRVRKRRASMYSGRRARDSAGYYGRGSSGGYSDDATPPPRWREAPPVRRDRGSEFGAVATTWDRRPRRAPSPMPRPSPYGRSRSDVNTGGGQHRAYRTSSGSEGVTFWDNDWRHQQDNVAAGTYGRYRYNQQSSSDEYGRRLADFRGRETLQSTRTSGYASLSGDHRQRGWDKQPSSSSRTNKVRFSDDGVRPPPAINTKKNYASSSGYERRTMAMQPVPAPSPQTPPPAPQRLPMARPRLVKTDMPERMYDLVSSITCNSLERHELDIDVSRAIKLRIENRLNGCWMVIVGDNFATFLTEDCFRTGTFAYFYVGRQAFLIFKCF
jgi:hypothetical protein